MIVLIPIYGDEPCNNHETSNVMLNALLRSSKNSPIPKEVVLYAAVNKLKPYLETCLSFERFGPHERKGHEFKEMSIEGQFYARTLTINYKRISFDIVALDSPDKRRHQTRRRKVGTSWQD